MDSGENDLITWSDETLIEMFQNDVSFYRSIVLLIHCSWGFTSTNSRYLCSSHRDATCVERVKKTRMKSLCSIDMQPLTDTSQIIIYIRSSDPTPLFQLFIKFSLLSLSSHKIAPQKKIVNSKILVAKRKTPSAADIKRTWNVSIPIDLVVARTPLSQIRWGLKKICWGLINITVPRVRKIMLSPDTRTKLVNILHIKNSLTTN